LVSVTGQALNMLCQFEFEQGADQFAGLTPALFDQTLEVDRIVTDQT
jgi:hypothetical protein